MKIRGVYNGTTFYPDNPEREEAEIDISAEELASQLKEQGWTEKRDILNNQVAFYSPKPTQEYCECDNPMGSIVCVNCHKEVLPLKYPKPIKPLKKKCEHEWELTCGCMIDRNSPPVYQCKKSGIHKSEPKPEQIEPIPDEITPLTAEELSSYILKNNALFVPNLAARVTEIKDKLNEIINHLTRGKG